MKILLLLLFFVCFSLVVNAQSLEQLVVNPPATSLDKTINDLEESLENEQNRLAELKIKYDENYKPVQESKTKIETITKELNQLKIERLKLRETNLYKALPNNQIQLLKLLIIQNQKIIELLTKQ